MNSKKRDPWDAIGYGVFIAILVYGCGMGVSALCSFIHAFIVMMPGWASTGIVALVCGFIACATYDKTPPKGSDDD